MANLTDLQTEADKLGVPTNSGYFKPRGEAYHEMAITEYELHRRIREEQRHRRENRLWVIAVVAATASAISAVAAWIAVFKSGSGPSAG